MGKTLIWLGMVGAFLTFLGIVVAFGDVVLLLYPLLLLVASVFFFMERDRLGIGFGIGAILMAFVDLLYYGPYQGNEGRTYLPGLPLHIATGVVVGSVLLIAIGVLVRHWRDLMPEWIAYASAAVQSLALLLTMFALNGTPPPDAGGDFGAVSAFSGFVAVLALASIVPGILILREQV